jgi:hypothetical protein
MTERAPAARRLDSVAHPPTSAAHPGFVAATMVLFIALASLTTIQMLADWTWWWDEGVRYRAATLAFNYIDLGAIRRGLGGTLLRLVGLEPTFGLAVFHGASTVFAAAVIAVLTGRRSTTGGFRLLSVIGLAALFLFWGADAGRTDVVLAGLLGLATLLAWRRPVLAAACLVVALGFHEMGLIYGVPLAAALWLDRRWQVQGELADPGAPSRRAQAGALVMVAAAAVCQLLVDHLPHADAGEVARWYWSLIPLSEYAEWPLYFFVAGTRGIEVAMCQNLTLDPNYKLHVVSGVGVIAAVVWIFDHRSRRGWQAPLLAAVLPYLFLSAVAIDLSRWSAFAALNAWFVCAARPPGDAGEPRRWSLVARGLLLCALIVVASPRHLVPVGHATFSPAPLIDRLSWKFTGPRHSPSIAIGLQRCDPTWRDLLVPKQQEPPRR